MDDVQHFGAKYELEWKPIYNLRNIILTYYFILSKQTADWFTNDKIVLVCYSNQDIIGDSINFNRHKKMEKKSLIFLCTERYFDEQKKNFHFKLLSKKLLKIIVVFFKQID